ncbi:MAG: tetratricopeptide repeat protein [Lentisphaeria bacterium]|nr:tetratricopeptide repeat protein [Lentisphaeria bacterium]
MNDSVRRLRVLALVLALAGSAHGQVQGYGQYSRQKEFMREGERLESTGRYKAAAKAYRRSGLYTTDNRTRAALLSREAECRFQAGQPYEAFAAYSLLLESYPLHASYTAVVPRLRQLAGQFERGDGTFLGISNRTKAIEVYELILQETSSGAAGLMQDSLTLGALLTQAGRPEEAVEIYRDALRRFPRDPSAPEARLALGRLLVEESRHGDGDGVVARQAARELNGFLESSPDSPRRSDAEFLLGLLDERRAETLCELGRFYMRPVHERRPAARRYLQAVLDHYGETAAASRAEVLLADLGPVTPEEEAVAAVEVPGPPLPPAPTPAPTPKPPARATDRLLEGALPDGKAEEGPARSFAPLSERENVSKWLLPLGDVNELKTGGSNE